ncbi:unnamed protein product [Prunus armeniaca]
MHCMVGKKVRICRRHEGRSSRQVSDTGVVPAKGSPMLKSAICDNFGRVTIKGSGSERFAQSFDVGLCASCCDGDTCSCKLGSAVGSFGCRKLRQSGALAGAYRFGRVSSFGREASVSVLVLVVLMLDMLG